MRLTGGKARIASSFQAREPHAKNRVNYEIDSSKKNKAFVAEIGKLQRFEIKHKLNLR